MTKESCCMEIYFNMYVHLAFLHLCLIFVMCVTLPVISIDFKHL